MIMFHRFFVCLPGRVTLVTHGHQDHETHLQEPKNETAFALWRELDQPGILGAELGLLGNRKPRIRFEVQDLFYIRLFFVFSGVKLNI